MVDSDKPNNEVVIIKQLKSIKVALWILVTVLVILPVIAAVGTGVVMGIMALGESKLNDGINRAMGESVDGHGLTHDEDGHGGDAHGDGHGGDAHGDGHGGDAHEDGHRGDTHGDGHGGDAHETESHAVADPDEDDSKGAISIVGEGESIVINPAGSGGTRYLLVDIYLVRQNEEDKTFRGAIETNSKKLQSLTMDKLSERNIEELSNPAVRKQIENVLKNQYQRILGSEHPIKELVVTRWIMQ